MINSSLDINKREKKKKIDIGSGWRDETGATNLEGKLTTSTTESWLSEFSSSVSVGVWNIRGGWAELKVRGYRGECCLVVS